MTHRAWAVLHFTLTLLYLYSVSDVRDMAPVETTLLLYSVFVNFTRQNVDNVENLGFETSHE